MSTFIYCLWALIPVFFFVLWSLSSLEKYLGKKKTETPEDFLMSFLFTSLCLGVFTLFDFYLIDFLTEDVAGGYFPRNALLFISYPLLLLIGAKIVGGSKPIRITKAPGKRS